MSKHYHFIGIGGIGMGALAALSLDKGYRVSGSDLRSNPMTERLKARGAEIFSGHAGENIGGADCVVFSSAIRDDNPELVEAERKKIPVLQRAKFLAELMEGYIGITVAGAHGKTTTTSMAADLLEEAGLQPTTAIGGIVNGTRAHAELGEGKYFVTEVDESDGSFLCFRPHYSIITNVDLEHVDYYHNWQNVLDAYRAFIGKTREGGTILAYGDDEPLLNMVKESGKSFKTYGFSPENNISAVNIKFDHFDSRFNCVVDGVDRGQVLLKIPGRHNIANALACISLGLSLSIEFDTICESLKSYKGVQRRFQLKSRVDDIWVIDDYAHHPTEIKATLETAQLFKRSVQEMTAGGETNGLIAVFQPHRYSRVKGLLEDFAQSLVYSDQLIVTDIYAASEQPIEGVTAEKLCEQIRAITDRPVCYIPKGEIIDHLLDVVKPQDLVLTLGAGDVGAIADDLAEALKKRSAAAEVS
ncbi:MAG: UDP-N-acetylmuramate--L-alanine ligase [Candidatus Omnitrophica bacterium]|nr:UDP-N-acetylmuramate--L-alanine ligase [Candidatus Omnitrophota bacterium]